MVARMRTSCLVRVNSKPIQSQSVKHGSVSGPTRGSLYTRADSCSPTLSIPPMHEAVFCTVVVAGTVCAAVYHCLSYFSFSASSTDVIGHEGNKGR